MKALKLICATLALAFASSGAASAQSLENENTVAFACEEASATSDSDGIKEVEVYPKEASFKVMIDIEEPEIVKVFNVAGVLVKEQKMQKGDSIDVESLIPGNYVVWVGDKKRGSFVKK